MQAPIRIHIVRGRIISTMIPIPIINNNKANPFLSTLLHLFLQLLHLKISTPFYMILHNNMIKAAPNTPNTIYHTYNGTIFIIIKIPPNANRTPNILLINFTFPKYHLFYTTTTFYLSITIVYSCIPYYATKKTHIKWVLISSFNH